MFMSSLFAQKPDDHMILIWTKRGETKLSNWFDDPEKAKAFALAQAKDCDVYVGCGTARKSYIESLGPKSQHRRCTFNTVAGIPALWIDIDLVDPTVHKKVNLPKSDSDINKILEAIPFIPTFSLNSGNGRQFWWVFREFWSFDSEEEREKAQDLAHRFLATVRDKARSLGFDVDATFDLTRLMRVPDTLNHKTSPPKPVVLIGKNGSHFNAQDFDDFIVDSVPKIKRMEGIIDGATLRLDPNANPPAEKLVALMEAEPRFKRSYNMDRKDFRDQSPSAYDFSLTTFAFQARWSPQEVVDLLISFRRKHGLDLKLRIDYYERTLAKAASSVTVEQAETNLENLILKIAEAKNLPPAERREEIRRNVSAIVGVPILRIVKFTSDPPEYRLETTLGSITLGAVHNLIEQRWFRLRLADATQHYMRPMKRVSWDQVAQVLLDACEEEDIGEEATEYGQAKAWIMLYLQNRKVLDDPDNAWQTSQPFVKGNRLYIFGHSLREYLSMFHRELVTQKRMGQGLKLFGFRGETMAFKGEKDTTTRYVWGIGRDHELIRHFI